jgi:hypothetical protein
MSRHTMRGGSGDKVALRRAARAALAIVTRSALTGRLAHATFTRRQTRAHLRT